jgi:hypothetical protein
MLQGVYIIVDDDFSDAVYADPPIEDLDAQTFEALCEAINDAIEGDGEVNGHRIIDDFRIGWRYQARLGLAFAAIVSEDVGPTQLDRYLKGVSRHYLDEVDSPRDPEREGVADVVADVIPPWDD